jgi:type VI secretion system secreted protein Hcp
MAQVDYFLKVDGVDGESQDAKYKNYIDVESWSWGETNSGSHSTGGGGGAGKVSMQDFHFVMKINKASPTLMLACASGKHIPKAVLTCRKAGEKQQDFFVVTMSDLLVSSYQTGGSGHSDVVPTDQISLNFAKVEFEYKEQTAKGATANPVKTGWDVKKNQKV